MNSATSFRSAQPKDALQVLLIFLRLGITSFGGPVAHLGYFRSEFVVRRQWLSERAYADLVALCQFLPGPASSQVGMSIGLQRAGLLGMACAWIGFTLPSALVLIGFALGISALNDLTGASWLLGLKAGAVAVVAHAVLGMAKSLTPDARRATIAVGVLALTLLVPGSLTMIGAIIAAGIAGYFFCRPPLRVIEDDAHSPLRLSTATAVASLALFVLLFAGLPFLVVLTENSSVSLFESFYRAGSLVFGGGHVVLPLLEADMVSTGRVNPSMFLAGYGAAQAVPGPLFTFAAYLGAVATGTQSAAVGAAIALFAIFLPSALLLIGVLPFWDRLRRLAKVQRVLMGVNAGVVGLLAAALYTPVFTDGVASAPALVVAAVAFLALTRWSAPAWAVVLGSAGLGMLLL